MKKVVRIFTMLSVVAMSCVLICGSGGGSSSDDDDAPAVSTTSTTATTPTNYLARVMYTSRRGSILATVRLMLIMIYTKVDMRFLGFCRWLV